MEQLLAEANGEKIDKKTRKSKKKQVDGAISSAPQPEYISSLLTPENMLRD